MKPKDHRRQYLLAQALRGESPPTYEELLDHFLTAKQQRVQGGQERHAGSVADVKAELQDVWRSMTPEERAAPKVRSRMVHAAQRWSLKHLGEEIPSTDQLGYRWLRDAFKQI